MYFSMYYLTPLWKPFLFSIFPHPTRTWTVRSCHGCHLWEMLVFRDQKMLPTRLTLLFSLISVGIFTYEVLLLVVCTYTSVNPFILIAFNNVVVFSSSIKVQVFIWLLEGIELDLSSKFLIWSTPLAPVELNSYHVYLKAGGRSVRSIVSSKVILSQDLST